MSKKIKLATNLPKPKPLTEEDIKMIDEESKKMVKMVEERTKNLELSSEDFYIVIR